MCKVVVRAHNLWAILLEFESWISHPLSVWPLASYLTSLCLNLFNCKIGIIIKPYGVLRIKWIKMHVKPSAVAGANKSLQLLEKAGYYIMKNNFWAMEMTKGIYGACYFWTKQKFSIFGFYFRKGPTIPMISGLWRLCSWLPRYPHSAPNTKIHLKLNIMHSHLKCLNRHITSWFWPDKPWVLLAELLVILAGFDRWIGRGLVDSTLKVKWEWMRRKRIETWDGRVGRPTAERYHSSVWDKIFARSRVVVGIFSFLHH